MTIPASVGSAESGSRTRQLFAFTSEFTRPCVRTRVSAAARVSRLVRTSGVIDTAVRVSAMMSGALPLYLWTA